MFEFSNLPLIERSTEAHRQDLLAQADQERLFRQALAAKPHRGRLLHRALARLGRNMVVWGLVLRYRYTHMEEPQGMAKQEQNQWTQNVTCKPMI